MRANCADNNNHHHNNINNNTDIYTQRKLETNALQAAVNMVTLSPRRRFRSPVCVTWFFDEFPLFEVRLVDSKRFPAWRQQTGSGLAPWWKMVGSDWASLKQ